MRFYFSWLKEDWHWTPPILALIGIALSIASLVINS